jgi:hypothetical protein
VVATFVTDRQPAVPADWCASGANRRATPVTCVGYADRQSTCDPDRRYHWIRRTARGLCFGQRSVPRLTVHPRYPPRGRRVSRHGLTTCRHSRASCIEAMGERERLRQTSGRRSKTVVSDAFGRERNSNRPVKGCESQTRGRPETVHRVPSTEARTPSERPERVSCCGSGPSSGATAFDRSSRPFDRCPQFTNTGDNVTDPKVCLRLNLKILSKLSDGELSD